MSRRQRAGGDADAGAFAASSARLTVGVGKVKGESAGRLSLRKWHKNRKTKSPQGRKQGCIPALGLVHNLRVGRLLIELATKKKEANFSLCFTKKCDTGKNAAFKKI